MGMYETSACGLHGEGMSPNIQPNRISDFGRWSVPIISQRAKFLWKRGVIYGPYMNTRLVSTEMKRAAVRVEVRLKIGGMLLSFLLWLHSDMSDLLLV